MTNVSDQLPNEEGAFDRLWWSSRGTVGKTVLIILIGILALFLLQPLFQPATSTSSVTVPMPAPESAVPLFVPSIQFTSSYYFAWGPQSQSNDIYRLNAAVPISQPVNLTNSPSQSEVWPVLSPTDERLAFLVISAKGERSLRVMMTDTQQIIDVAYNNAGSSGLGSEYQIDVGAPPSWSPDGEWLAFLGQSLSQDRTTVELFVANVRTSTVYRLTSDGGVIVAPRWIDNVQLIFGKRVSDSKFAIFKTTVLGLPTISTATPLTTLEPK